MTRRVTHTVLYCKKTKKRPNPLKTPEDTFAMPAFEVSAVKTPVFSGENPRKTEIMPQSKVKQSKVNKSKAK